MKKKYLGFLPLLIVEVVSHWIVISGYISYQHTHDIFDVSPIAAAVVFVFWIAITILGIAIATN